MNKYEQDDPIGFWTRSANIYQGQIDDYNEKISALEVQISYAKDVENKCNELFAYDSYVDGNLSDLGNALSEAMSEEVSSCVTKINSANSEYIDSAVAECDALIQKLNDEKSNLESARDTAQGGLDWSNNRVAHYKNLGY